MKLQYEYSEIYHDSAVSHQKEYSEIYHDSAVSHQTLPLKEIVEKEKRTIGWSIVEALKPLNLCLSSHFINFADTEYKFAFIMACIFLIILRLSVLYALVTNFTKTACIS